MLLLCFCFLALHMPFAAEVHQAYADQDVEALRTLLGEASTRTDSFLVRYRLYPLTEEAALLDDLPADLGDGSAQDFALLSGLWSYRAGEASVFRVIQYGRRSSNLLERAKSIDPTNPYVLLVEGQSLLFRPAFAGRDAGKAAHCFEQLRTRTGGVEGISRTEASVWYWLALREAGQNDEATTLRERLLGEDPPPLYRQFLDDPPDV